MRAFAVIGSLFMLACGSTVERSSPASPGSPASTTPGTPGLSQAGASANEPKASPKPVADSTSGKPASKKPKVDPLFPKATVMGWKQLGADDRAGASAIADDYIQFLARGKTPRRAVAALVALASDSGARLAKDDERGLTGFHYAVEPGNDAAVFFRSGTLPVSKGISVIVVSVDAPRLVLKQVPQAVRSDIEVLQTTPHGDLSLRSWMVHPMALDIFVEKRGKPVAFSIGESPDDPVLSIPDLLPHLSWGSQVRGREVRDAERLDPISAASAGGLEKALAAKKLVLADLESAEAYIVPAAAPVRVGVDRALIGGYGHGNRALAYAAVRALAESTTTRAAAVIVIGQSEENGSSSDYSFVSRALRKTIAALADDEVDVYDTQIAVSNSAALVGRSVKGQRNGGVILDIGSADTLPLMARTVLSVVTAVGVPFELRDKTRGGAGRDLSSLGLDAIGFAIPTTGHGSPGGTVSVFDLYQGVRACRAWLSRSL